MTMKRSQTATRIAALAACAAAVVFAAACSPIEKDNDAISQLYIESITGNLVDGSESSFVQSDVLYQNTTTGVTTVYADTASVLLGVRQLDPQPLMGPSSFANVTVTHYSVSYFRSDGKSTPGIDVPYGFSGPVTVRVVVGTPTALTLVIVREAAKQEAPLINILQAGTRAEVIAATAKIEIYGIDGSNKTVKTTGYIPVYFANFANE
jgi:hypothetical protein